MHWIEKIATKCVILSQKKKKFFFTLDLQKTGLSTKDHKIGDLK